MRADEDEDEDEGCEGEDGAERNGDGSEERLELRTRPLLRDDDDDDDDDDYDDDEWCRSSSLSLCCGGERERECE